jgi:hypothetical protein
MSNDRGLAALAERLHRITTSIGHKANVLSGAQAPDACETSAAAILGERAVFLPDGLPELDGALFLLGERKAEIERLRVALDEVYDKAPGPWLALVLSTDTQAVLAETGRKRSGRGRVTSRKFDQRLKVNRDRRAALVKEADHA